MTTTPTKTCSCLPSRLPHVSFWPAFPLEKEIKVSFLELQKKWLANHLDSVGISRHLVSAICSSWSETSCSLHVPCHLVSWSPGILSVFQCSFQKSQDRILSWAQPLYLPSEEVLLKEVTIYAFTSEQHSVLWRYKITTVIDGKSFQIRVHSELLEEVLKIVMPRLYPWSV